MFTSRRSLAVLVGAAAVALLAPACSGSGGERASADAGVPVDGGRVRVGVTRLSGSAILSFEPGNSGGVLAADLVFDGLTAYRDDEDRVVSSIALKWLSADGVTWTFSLDPGRSFSDGSPVTAADVVASLSRVAKAGQRSLAGARLGVIQGAAEYVAGTADHVSGLAATDPHTVTITTTTPYQELPALLADPSYGIAPAAELPPGSTEVGSGPFKVVKADATHVVLDRTSPSLAHVDGVDFTVFESDDDALAAFDRHEVDVAPLPSTGERPKRRQSVSSALVYLSFNVHSPAFADVQARQGVMKALDRSAIVKRVPNGRATVAEGFVPEVVHSFGQCTKLCRFDRNGAKELIGKVWGATPPKVRLGYLADTDMEAMASEIAEQLQDVGVTVEMQKQTAQQLTASVAAGTNDLFLFGSVGLAPTPDPYLADTFGTNGAENTSGFTSTDVDQAVSMARGEANDRDRATAYAAVERLVIDAVPAVPIASVHHEFTSISRLRDDDPSTGVIFDGRRIWLSKS